MSAIHLLIKLSIYPSISLSQCLLLSICGLYISKYVVSMYIEKFIEWKSINLDYSLLVSNLPIIYYVVLENLFNYHLPYLLCLSNLVNHTWLAYLTIIWRKKNETNVKTFWSVKCVLSSSVFVNIKQNDQT